MPALQQSLQPRAVASVPGRDAAGPPAPGARRVLVVDPCEDTVLSTSWLLRLWGYDVRSAATRPLALEAARDYRPDAILMELRLPGLDGWQVARKLGRPGPCLIAVTGRGSEQDRARSRDAGFTCHPQKPAFPDALRERLASLTGIPQAGK